MPRNNPSLGRSQSETRSRVMVVLLSSLFAMPMSGCSKDESAAAAVMASAATAPEPPIPKAVVPVPSGEPPADVVRALMFEEYAELEKAGGMPVTVTATGQGMQLRAKLFDARKEKCVPLPQTPPGQFECHLTINVAITGNGSDPAFEDPSEQGARIFVYWDPSGKWARHL